MIPFLSLSDHSRAFLMLGLVLTLCLAASALAQAPTGGERDFTCSWKSTAQTGELQYRVVFYVEQAGLRATELDPEGRDRLLDLIRLYVDHMRDGHAQVRMEQVRNHLNDTYIAWIGGIGPEPVYYRIQSPVLLIEFDHAVRRSIPGPPGVPLGTTSTPSSARPTAATTARASSASTTRPTRTIPTTNIAGNLRIEPQSSRV